MHDRYPCVYRLSGLLPVACGAALAVILLRPPLLRADQPLAAPEEHPSAASEPARAERAPTAVAPAPTAVTPASAQVLTGLDVLRRDRFSQLAGRTVGLITNHTGVDRDGQSAIRLLHDAPNVKLAVVFSPEHGLEGKLDVSRVGDTRDAATGIRVYSLYGETRRPTPEMLQGLDALVFDIQDIGARFYTYVSTMGNAMEEASKHGLEFFVLDRPNPIGGLDVEGPLLDLGKESFVGYHRLPIRHGMTVGELARMFNDELKMELKLTVVPVEGWSRGQLFDATGLAWINPSPNMRSLTEALLYPGIGLLETTNLSVGRGTETPFELFGAPWLDGDRLAKALGQADTPGVAFEPVRFTPQASKFQGEACGGVRVRITDRAALRPVRVGLEIAVQLRRLYPDLWDIDGYAHLLRNDAVLDSLRQGKTAAQIEAGYQEDLAAFLRRRAAFLLY
ncbi:MAG: exo-beta-N-acetylmuramidase NamZ family protein [Thermoguttaceae bacterium]